MAVNIYVKTHMANILVGAKRVTQLPTRIVIIVKILTNASLVFQIVIGVSILLEGRSKYMINRRGIISTVWVK